jgi:ribosomal protein L40E
MLLCITKGVLIMRAVLSPPIARLINLGRDAVLGRENSGEILKAVDDAEKYLAEYKALFRLLSSSLFIDKESETVLKLIDKHFRDLEKHVRDLRAVFEKDRLWDLNPVLHHIEDTSVKLVSAIQEVKDMEGREETYSPFPVINSCIRAALNVANGKEPVEALAGWLPPLAELIDRLDGTVRRFEELHGDEKELCKAAGKLVEDLREGVGALSAYIKDKKPVQIADGMRLLKYPSKNISVLLKEMDLKAMGDESFSRLPALEEFSLAYKGWKDGKVSWEAVQGAFGSLTFLASFYDDIHAAIKGFPLFFAVENAWNAAQINRIQFRTFFSSFAEKMKAKSKNLDLNELRRHFENYSAIVSQIVQSMEKEILKVSKSPYIEELKELAGRAVNGTVVLEYFARKVEAFAQSHNEIKEEFRRGKSAPGAPGEVKEVYEILAAQGKGIDEMLRFFEDNDRQHLFEGLAMLEKPLPRLLEIQKAAQETIQEKVLKERGKKPICIKCSMENNVGAKICKKCGALLPLIVQEGGAAEASDYDEPSPLNIARIEDAVARFEKGNLKAGELKSEIKSYLNKLEGVRSDFERRAKAALQSSKNDEIRESAEQFSKSIASMREALETMLMFESSPDFLFQGLQAFQAAAGDVVDIRKSLKGG